MPGTVAAAVKAANVRFVVPSAVLLAGALWVVGGATVGMVGVPVRSRWFVMLVFAVVAGVPLETRFGVIETCLARPARCFGPGWCSAGRWSPSVTSPA